MVALNKNRLYQGAKVSPRPVRNVDLNGVSPQMNL